ncbi:MAG: hypothetical protein ACD_28C00192G0004 [uncultured bacterium]|nr:MAG: hypothetical protein ACD_28C00192G0004 [uncultured bacterium]
MNHWISLYLSGQYPGFYRLPNRFEILLKIRLADSTNFEDSMVSLLKDKSDVEFYNSLLSAFESIHGADEFQKLLEILKVPKEVMRNPNEKNAIQNIPERIDLKKFSVYLDSLNETDFSRFVVMPILQAMGYENVEFKGKVNETDS